MNYLNKIFSLAIVSSIMALSLPNTSFARDTDFSNGASFAWSPYSWTASSYVSSSNANTIVGAWNNIKFNQTAVDMHNSSGYVTLEINNTTDNLPHTSWYATNLPRYAFDTDDDEETLNGLHEEAEVYSNGGTLVAGTAYYFQTSWKKNTTSAMSGNFNFIIQRSLYNPINGEMEGYDYDKIDNKAWSLSKTTSTYIHENTFLGWKSTNTTLSKKPIYISHNVKNKKDFHNFLSKQDKWATVLDGKNVEIVFTFAQPLSEQEVKDFVSGHNVHVSSYTIKMLDEKNERVTVGGKPEGKELFPASRLNEVTEGKNLQFAGFISLVGTIDTFTLDKYTSLKKDQRIFVADLTKAYTKEVLKDISRSVRVADFSWDIDTLQ